MANIYYQKAQQQYDPAYNRRQQDLKNQLAQNQANLEQQKAGINANYDNQVAQQNLQNRYSKNNFSNTMLGRGIANSSIAGTGLAEMDLKNNRVIGNINNARLGDLNNIEQQKAILAQNLNNTLSQMSADREKELWALANQMQDRDRDWNFKQSQLELQRQAQALEAEYKRAQINAMNKSKEKDYSQIMGEIEFIMNDPSTTDQEKKHMFNTYKVAYGNTEDKHLNKLLNKYSLLVTGRDMASGLFKNYFPKSGVTPTNVIGK